MRVMLVAPYFPPEVTGSSNFVSDLASGLVAQGHEVCVVTAAEDAYSDQYRIEILASRRVKPGRIAFDYSIPVVLNRKNIARFKKFFDEFKPDVVSVHGQIFDITIIAARMARKRGIATTMTVHSAIWHDNKVFNFILNMGDHLFAKFLLRPNIGAWIGVDDRTVSHTLQIYNKTCTTIPVCIRRNAFTGGNAEAAREKYGITGDPVIASIGHVVPVRNRVALIDALPPVIEQFPNIQVVIAGRVADTTFLDRAKELGIEKSLRVIGAVPHADIAGLLACARLEIHDLQGYGFGIASLEPIDAGVPVLAHVRNDNLPGVDLQSYSPESFLPDNNPHTLTPAIIRALTDEEFRARIMAGQQKLVDEVYSQTTVTNKYVGVFNEVLGALHS